MGFLVVVFSELCGAVESGIVEFECLPETFDLALCGGFSNGTHDVFYAMRLEVGCELASSVVAVELCAMIAEDLFRCSSEAEGCVEEVEDSAGCGFSEEGDACEVA